MKALIVVDVQNDFCEGGKLAVSGGNSVVPKINKLIGSGRYDFVVLTQDFHPANHSSFASNHNAEPFSQTVLIHNDVEMNQTLWPDHCVQGTPGAYFHSELNTDAAQFVIRKGMNSEVDSYSGFWENDGKTTTGLTGLLKGLGVASVDVVGIATDYCVAFTAIDSAKSGFKTKVILDCCASINMNGSLESAYEKMWSAGVDVVE